MSSYNFWKNLRLAGNNGLAFKNSPIFYSVCHWSISKRRLKMLLVPYLWRLRTKRPKVKNPTLKTYQPSYRHCTSKSPFTRLLKNVISIKRSLKNISIIFHMILQKTHALRLRRGHYTSFTSQLNFWFVPPCFCELLLQLLPMTHMMLHSDPEFLFCF